MTNIWYPVVIKKSFDKIDRFKLAVKLYVKVNEQHFDDDEVTFTLWNGGTDGSDDLERLSLYEAIDSLKSVRDKDGKPTFIQDEKLDLEWNKCINQDKKYNNR